MIVAPFVIADAEDRAEQQDDIPLIYSTLNGDVFKVMSTSKRHSPSEAADLYRRMLALADGETKNKKSIVNDSSISLLAPYLSETHSSSWVNSTIVDKWFDYLAENYKDRKVENIDCACLDGDLTKDSLEDYLQEVSKQGAKQRERGRLKNANTILYPIAQGHHYYLLVIEKNRRNVTVSCLDGLNCHNHHSKYLKHGVKLVRALFGEDAIRFKIKTESIIVPQQKGTDDCAPVICYTAERICAGKSLLDLTGFCDYSQVRIRIAAILSSLAPAVFFSNGRRQRLNSSMEKPEVIDLEAPVDPKRRPVEIIIDDHSVFSDSSMETPKSSPVKSLKT